MAANNGKNKRIPIKWIRDGAKAAYDKKAECFICGAREELELHHTHGLTNLLMEWAKRNKIKLDTDEQVLEIRDRFIEEHHQEIYVDVFTLCAPHHSKLHAVYGKSPALTTASKQVSWIEKQKDRHNGNSGKDKELDDGPRVDFRETKSSSDGNLSSGGFSNWYRNDCIKFTCI